MSAFRYVLADVFTDRPLAGNQLAVFTDARELPEEQLQPLARELNLSETVYVFPPEQGGHVRIRIFTPTSELPFAGHPVLGAAFVLGGPLQLEEIALETGAGIVPVRLEREGPRIVFGWMRQPVPEVGPLEREAELLSALGVEGSELPVEHYALGPGFAMVGLASPEAVAALEPDQAALARLPLAAYVFAADGDAWKARTFLPAFGIAEDPATGSGAGPLALHLARHGRVAWGDEVVIEQGAEVGRPSRLHARAYEDRLEVGGSAVVVARGEFRL